MNRTKPTRKPTQWMLQDQIRGAIQDWKWPLNATAFHKVCPHSNRSNTHFLLITGVVEWQMANGFHVRSIAWRCPRCGDTWELRQLLGAQQVGWSEVFVLHNGEYSGAAFAETEKPNHDNTR